MTALPSKSYIDSLNIDSVERAIVFAGLCLKLAEDVGLKSPDTSIQINPKVDRVNSAISITAEIPYLSRFYHGSGGKLIDNLKLRLPTAVGVIEDFIYFNVQPSEVLTPPIPPYPFRVETFEQYLVHYSFILWASLPEDFSKIINFRFIEATEEESPKVQLNIALPINFRQWLLGDNYINSVSRVVDSYQTPEEDKVLSLLTNQQLLTNTQLLVN